MMNPSWSFVRNLKWWQSWLEKITNTGSKIIVICTSGTLIHPSSYMNSWNLWIHLWKNHMNWLVTWIHIQVTWIHEYEFMYEMIIWILCLYEFFVYMNSYMNDHMNSWVHEFMSANIYVYSEFIYEYMYVWIHVCMNSYLQTL